MSNATSQIGRLAFRVEGDYWIAYYAMPGSMDGALRLGSIAIRFAQDIAKRDRFIAIMRDAVSDLIEETAGTRPEWPDGPQPAPENERAGRA